ncbi:hypothetical protein N7448_003285 [Penicillium atrosanguineum]|uniref:Uncharacterized protein n=1 Tax=Penicillium atrosanguineum TaxID=1132637 RepID=A0A9W9PVT1_9EURO|nr:uncharacterized protein N7443_002255 [Penicillium atrosanguineum]KAJ5122153.1 hypothetical protein N7526_009090 [Penicillium atrosanguineum]KAJ5139877.1 hypothetical protein N7448_003285 [Penicillium atrosanguineum]KAJ5309794.1 hypothetical protein N7443_002255 [Penicillium atrosanguineum]KAJ5315314.1 hypothetical protein N7476_005621 [Penicillium atrosanguineum]
MAPTSKADTSRFPQSQDPKSARAQAQQTSSQKSEEDSWSPNQTLSTHMDATGHPVPDPVTDTKSKKSKEFDDDADVFEAMTADFD